MLKKVGGLLAVLVVVSTMLVACNPSTNSGLTPQQEATFITKAVATGISETTARRLLDEGGWEGVATSSEVTQSPVRPLHMFTPLCPPHRKFNDFWVSLHNVVGARIWTFHVTLNWWSNCTHAMGVEQPVILPSITDWAKATGWQWQQVIQNNDPIPYNFFGTIAFSKYVSGAFQFCPTFIRFITGCVQQKFPWVRAHMYGDGWRIEGGVP